MRYDIVMRIKGKDIKLCEISLPKSELQNAADAIQCEFNFGILRLGF